MTTPTRSDATLHYTHHLNPRVAVAVARHLKAPVSYVRSSPRDPKHEAEFRALNPNALCPILVEGERVTWETDAVACRLSQRVGSNFWRSGEQLVEMVTWLSWAAYHLNNAGSLLYFERVSRPPFSDERAHPSVVDDALRDYREYATVLDQQLAKRTWLLGNEISYADFRVASVLPFTAAAGLPVEGLSHVKRWHDQLLEIDAWRAPFDGLTG